LVANGGTIVRFEPSFEFGRAVKENGEKRIVTREQRVRPWWRTDAASHVFMSIKYGGKTVEFDKDKSGIAVPSVLQKGRSAA
jgi:hypothetical protein